MHDDLRWKNRTTRYILPHHWLWEWFFQFQFHRCTTYSLLSRSPSIYKYFNFCCFIAVAYTTLDRLHAFFMFTLKSTSCWLCLFRVHSLHRTALSEKYYRELPKHHHELLPGFCNHLAAIRTCIDHNYEIIKLIIADADHMFENRLDYFDTVSILPDIVLYLGVCVP